MLEGKIDNSLRAEMKLKIENLSGNSPATAELMKQDNYDCYSVRMVVYCYCDKHGNLTFVLDDK